MTHSTGFPEDNPWGDQQLDATDELMSAWMREGIPFSTAPGTAFEYSNYGFSILGRIIANVSGVSYPRYMRERLLEPLGMSVTTLEASAVPADRFVRADGRNAHLGRRPRALGRFHARRLPATRRGR
jgi:CubicO group peptidase (beta-lactamase class C family)